MERFERKHLIVASAAAMAVLGVVFGFASAPWLIIAAGFLLTACSNVFSNGFHIYQAEIFPTRMRSTAVSTSYSLSRLSGAMLPFISVAALDHLGPTAVFLGSAAILVIVCARRRPARAAEHRPEPRGQLGRDSRRRRSGGSTTGRGSAARSRRPSRSPPRRRARAHARALTERPPLSAAAAAPCPSSGAPARSSWACRASASG